jgi:hypothetical protein
MAIFEVFYQPGKLFASLPERRYAWVLPLILGTLLLLGVTIAVVQLIGMETIVRQQIQNTRLSPEQMQAALARANSPVQLYITYTASVLGGVLVLVVIAGVLSLFAMMGSRQPPFGTMFSMVTLASLPYRLVICVMSLLVLFASPDRSSLDYSNMLATNVAAFMDKETTSKWLYSLMGSIDILSFFEIGLLAYGFSKLTKTSVFFGLVAVGTLWGVYVFAKVALSMLF